MNRDDMLQRIEDPSQHWDFIIIGGGATGMGTVVEAASRGYSSLLLEQSDFGKGTSSRSTKLIHGGVRYLQQGHVSLVIESLKERAVLLRNAPHLVHDCPFVVPNYDWWEGPFYGVGLKIYDMLAGKHGFGSSRHLTRQETIDQIPTVETDGLRGGVVYFDGQFDDARLVINLAETAAEQGATLLNYMPVSGLLKKNGLICGVRTFDCETEKEYEILANAVINTTGVFADTIRRMDDLAITPMVRASQGVHIVLKYSFLSGESAIMVPHTEDGRVLFAVPWQDRVIVGTTDTAVDTVVLEPRALDVEVEFLLTHAARYLTKDPTAADVLSIFAGLRPLVGTGHGGSTASLSRDYAIHVSRSGLLTIAGGKWTTYRKMAEDTVDHAAIVAHLDVRPSVSKDLAIHGYHRNADAFRELRVYGSDAPAILDLTRENRKWQKRIHPEMSTTAGEVIWAVRHEMARTVEDFLARRIRALILDAKMSMEMAPVVSQLMGKELKRDASWQKEEARRYKELAQRYLLT